MVQPHTTVRRGALSRDSPGPARRAPGVCLQEPRGAGSVGAAPPPAAAQASGASPGVGGSGQVSEDRLSGSVSPFLMIGLRFLSQQRGAREILGWRG